jgi:uncharacterized membrane protein YedE/YeeE
MFQAISDPALLALIGLTGGMVLGLAARLGRFCTLGAIEDFLYQGSNKRLSMWGLAIGTAALATTFLTIAGALDPSRSVYALSLFSPLASIIGGLLFGYGMSLAGNCGFGALARTGGGDLRAFVIVLVMGISAYSAIAGPLAAIRAEFIDSTQLAKHLRLMPDVFAQRTGLPAALFSSVASLAILAVALRSAELRRDRSALGWGIAVGLAVAGGWAGTAWVARHGFHATAVESFTFTAPLGESLLYLMTSSGGGLSFSIGAVAGVLLGAFAGSLIKGHFRWEACEDPRELKRQCIGAVCMGVGAVFATGCTIGQGVSAFALFTFSAPLTFAAIFAGAALGLRQLITGFALTR